MTPATLPTSFVSGHFLGWNDYTGTWTSIYGVLNKFFTTTAEQSLLPIGNPVNSGMYSRYRLVCT